MPWIEGIGDEVLVIFSALVGICIILAAWLSTGIRDIPFISVIIVQLTRRRAANRNGGGNNATDNTQNNVTDNTENSGTTNVTTPESDESVESTSETQTTAQSAGNRDDSKVKTDTREAEAAVSKPDLDRNETTNEQKVTGHDARKESCQKPDSEDATNDLCQKSDSEESDTPCSEEELRKRRVEFFSETCPVPPVKDEEPQRDSSDSTPVVSDAEKHSSVDDAPRPKSLTQLASNILSEGLRIPEQQTDTNVESLETPSAPEAQNETSETNFDTPEPVADGHIRVRIKFLNDTQKLVTCLPSETIGNFRRTHFSQELSQSKLVRFIFNGQVLGNDTSTLQSYSIIDNSVVHCLVTAGQNEEQEQPHLLDDDGFDIGIYMFPIFGALLAFVWYTRFMYRQFFNVTSTLTLGGITFLYIAALLSTVRGHRVHEHLE